MHLHHRHHHCSCYCRRKELKLQGVSGQCPQLLAKVQYFSSAAEGWKPKETPGLHPGHLGVRAGSGASPACGSQARMGGVPPPSPRAEPHWRAMQYWCGVVTRTGLTGLALAQGPILWLRQGPLPFLNMTSQGPRQTAWPGRSGV